MEELLYKFEIKASKVKSFFDFWKEVGETHTEYTNKDIERKYGNDNIEEIMTYFYRNNECCYGSTFKITSEINYMFDRSVFRNIGNKLINTYIKDKTSVKFDNVGKTKFHSLFISAQYGSKHPPVNEFRFMPFSYKNLEYFPNKNKIVYTYLDEDFPTKGVTLNNNKINDSKDIPVLKIRDKEKIEIIDEMIKEIKPYFIQGPFITGLLIFKEKGKNI